MRKFKRNIRGQFVVIAALLIAILTLSVALSVHQINLHRQQLRYEPVEELVLGITSDLDRCLSNALSRASHKYHQTESYELAVREGREFISTWRQSVAASYAHLGIRMLMEDEEGKSTVTFSFRWGIMSGFSYVYTKFYLNIDAYGFKGWVGRSSKSVSLEILSVQNNTVKFRIYQSKMYERSPIPNLTPESLYETRIYVISEITSEGYWAHLGIPDFNITISNLTYLGEGEYNANFVQLKEDLEVPVKLHGVQLTVNTPEDNILVSAISGVFIKLQSQEENSQTPTNEGTIQFDGINYNLPADSIMTTPGVHMVKYYPEGTDTFINWTTTENVKALNPKWHLSQVDIFGNGTITAFYKKTPVRAQLTLDSRQLDNSTQHLGDIIFNTTVYTELPVDVALNTGIYYDVEYKPENSTYHFWGWYCYPPENFNLSGGNPARLIASGNGTVIAVYNTTTPELAFIELYSQEENSVEPTNLGEIQVDGNVYTLPNSTSLLAGFHLLKYFPETGYKFLNWTILGDISVLDPYNPSSNIMVNGNGSIIAFYRGYKIKLDSRQCDGSSMHLGNITFGSDTYSLPYSLTGVVGGDYTLKYMPENSSYQFSYWKLTGEFEIDNWEDVNTTIRVIGDVNITAVYCLERFGDNWGVEWDVLYLCDLPPTMLLPYLMLPQHYFNPRSSTLPIPPRDSWQYIDVCTPPTQHDMTLATYANITIYIQLASDKAESIGIELKFTYNDKTHLIGNTTFNVEVGEAWYTYIIDTSKIDKLNWPIPGEPIIPANSTIILTVIVPPDSGTLHIIYGWDRYQSVVDMFEDSD